MTEESTTFLAAKRIALVTGANRGIGLETCRQLAAKGITVVLTARDEEKGVTAAENLKHSGLSDYVIFHKLDVTDPGSVSTIVEFIKDRFGKLDILVNNAAIQGVVIVDPEALVNSAQQGPGFINWHKVSTQNYDLAEECINTNYYGAKKMTEATIPLLQLSDSPRIVNVSSLAGKLELVCNEWAKSVLGDEDSLSEYRVDEVLTKFLQDFKAKTGGWPTPLSAYKLSKASMNAYTRILAKKYPNIIANAVCPGFVRTDMNYKVGELSVEEGAESPAWLAVLPQGGPSGLFFSRKVISPF